MGAARATASSAAVQRSGVAATAPANRRRQPRPPLTVAQGRRKKTEDPQDGLDTGDSGAFEWKGMEVSPSLAAQTDDLVQMLPDPANPPESLLDEDFNSLFTGPGSGYPTASGSDFDWQAPGGSDWLMSEFYDGSGSGGGGQEGGGGSLAGAGAGSDFFQLRSEDWADSLVNEVGEGNSFRREQRERYGPPLVNMTNLAHATEEELLMSAQQQSLQDDQIEQVMDVAMQLHHGFLENSVNRYAVAVRFGEILEEIEYDDWALPMEGEEQELPSWFRAKFRLAQEYDELNQRAAEADELASAAEVRFFEEQVEKHLDQQLELLDRFERGISAPRAATADPLEDMLRVPLPGAEEDESPDGMTSDSFANDLLAKATAGADRDFLAVLSGDNFEDEEVEVEGAEQGAAAEEDGEEEAEEGEGDGEEAGGEGFLEEEEEQRRQLQPAAQLKERKKTKARVGQYTTYKKRGAAAADPLLDLFDV